MAFLGMNSRLNVECPTDYPWAYPRLCECRYVLPVHSRIRYAHSSGYSALEILQAALPMANRQRFRSISIDRRRSSKTTSTT